MLKFQLFVYFNHPTLIFFLKITILYNLSFQYMLILQCQNQDPPMLFMRKCRKDIYIYIYSQNPSTNLGFLS